ncbi:GW dipeptide domain-containing protein [Desemzia sp. FAM 23989]|uniref:GW dipeptide domain-containing protein n=1 Tax=Desemzia sp. FAM 23989 TaxID=3259523 RepID=UPI0038847DE9
MKNNNKKKLFITLSSGILLSLATNQDVIYAVETNNIEHSSNINIEVVNNSIIIEELVAYNMDDENKEEVQDLIGQVKITRIDEKTYSLTGNTLDNSEVTLVINDITKYVSQANENGYFEMEIKDFTDDSTIQAFIKENSEITYAATLQFIEYFQELEIIKNGSNLENSNSNENVELKEETFPEVEEPVETPVEEATPEVEEPVERPVEETVPEVEEPEETPVEEATPEVEEPEETPVEEATPEVEEPEETPVEEATPEVEEPEETPVEEATPEVEEPEETPVEEATPKVEKTAETPVKEAAPEAEAPKAKMATMSTFSLASTVSTRSAINGVYTVQSGDSLGAIANSFNLSLSQVLQWNPQIKNANLISVGQKINVTKEAYNKYLEDNKGNNQAQPRPFKTNQEFIDFIAPFAVEIANAYGKPQLYASVMISQAAHESNFGKSLLSLPPYYNLFGIKGTYNGESVPMGTWEDLNGNISNITANFRDYPSYYESMMDYADLLRGGLSSNSNFYSGAWVINTNSYQDATKYLTGTYATDTKYNIKVNNYIEQYNLTQYDTKIVDSDVENTINVSYDALVSLSGYTIDTKPWGTPGYQMVDKTNTYLGSSVRVIKETTNSKYALISYNGTVLGWVDKKALEISSEIKDVDSSVPVDYKAEISKTGYSIDTLPWGTSGYRTIAKSTDYIGQEVDVVKEAKNGSYSLISLNGELLGWIDSKAIAFYDVETDISSSHDTLYNAVISKTGFSVDTKPWGTSGYHTLSSTSDYLGRTIQVVKETNNKNYVLISYDGELLGWVDKKSLRTFEVVTNVASTQAVSYNATIGSTSYSIDTMPWGTAGYQTIAKTNDYVGAEVKVIRKTNNGNYVLISINGELLGWVDKKAVQTYTVDTNVSSSKTVSYNAILKSGYSVDTKPWGTTGYQTIAKTTDYKGIPVSVTKEKGAYALVESNGKVLGWVDKKALQSYTVDTNVSSSKPVSYSATISSSGYSVDTKPWGTRGYKTIAKTTDYIGRQIKVVKEKGAYALISLDGVTFGWVDKKSLSN